MLLSNIKYSHALGILVFFLLQSISFAKEEYILGSDDIVHVTVYGQSDLTTVARINELGKISFPLIGDVKIGGVSVSQAEAAISSALKKGSFVHSPQVRIVIEQYRSRQVSVLGQVNKPGKYTIEGASTLVDLIAMAGGLNQTAAEYVQLINDTKDIPSKVIDLYDILHKGNIALNTRIENGDIIFVPTMSKFYIYGEVNRPGVYRLERDMILMQALAVGGGITLRGTERGIQIKRDVGKGQFKDMEVRLTERLMPNDVIYIKESLF